MMPPQLEHGWLAVDRRHRVDALRRVIHSLNAQRALVFMNFQHRLKARDFACRMLWYLGRVLCGSQDGVAPPAALIRSSSGRERCLMPGQGCGPQTCWQTTGQG